MVKLRQNKKFLDLNEALYLEILFTQLKVHVSFTKKKSNYLWLNIIEPQWKKDEEMLPYSDTFHKISDSISQKFLRFRRTIWLDLTSRHLFVWLPFTGNSKKNLRKKRNRIQQSKLVITLKCVASPRSNVIGMVFYCLIFWNCFQFFSFLFICHNIAMHASHSSHSYFETLLSLRAIFYAHCDL